MPNCVNLRKLVYAVDTTLLSWLCSIMTKARVKCRPYLIISSGAKVVWSNTWKNSRGRGVLLENLGI